MQANELRVGNWVNYKNVTVPISLQDLARIMDGHYAYSPIPLTPEIVQDLGFEDYGNPYPTKRLSDGVMISLFRKTAIWIYFYDGKDVKVTTGSGCREHHHIKHLHQLQNLYFSLTNTELQWNRKQ